MKKYNNYRTILLLLFLIVIVIVGLLCYFVFNSSFFTKKNTNKVLTSLSHLGNKTFISTCKYADVEYTTSQDAETLFITVKYKDLTGVSAIHIHVNNNGTPGPILAWLGTTDDWQQGVTQNTPGTNSPCCNINNPLCSLIAPLGTPNINNLSNSVMKYTVKNNCCNKYCPWIESGTLLDVHGLNFQKVINCQLTKEKPGLDLISNTPFLPL